MTNESDELEKIMNEIEQLQGAMGGSPAAKAAPAKPEAPQAVVDMSSPLSSEEEDILREIQASAQLTNAAIPADMQGNMEETLADLKGEETGSSLLDEVPTEQEESIHMGSKTDGSLTMTLTGNMTLKLKYEYEGQEVTIGFADQALRVQLSDGTEFKVPVARLAQGQPSGNVRPFKKIG